MSETASPETVARVRALLAAEPGLSERQAAARLGCSHSTIGRAKRVLAEERAQGERFLAQMMDDLEEEAADGLAAGTVVPPDAPAQPISNIIERTDCRIKVTLVPNEQWPQDGRAEAIRRGHRRAFAAHIERQVDFAKARSWRSAYSLHWIIPLLAEAHQLRAA